jgi:hypothetical protein
LAPTFGRRFTSYFNFKTDETKSDFCDPVPLCGDFRSCKTAFEERESALGREAHKYMSWCESMDLDKTNLRYEAVLSVHALLGQGGKRAQQFAQPWNDRCQMSEFCFFKLCLMIKVKMIWISITGGCIVDHKHSFIKFWVNVFYLLHRTAILTLINDVLNVLLINDVLNVLSLVFIFYVRHGQQIIISECSFFVTWGYLTLSITQAHSTPDSKIREVSIPNFKIQKYW